MEFATQILQLILGHQVPEVRERPTLDALRNMERLGLIAPERAANLISGYTFLRKLEHRANSQATSKRTPSPLTLKRASG